MFTASFFHDPFSINSAVNVFAFSFITILLVLPLFHSKISLRTPHSGVFHTSAEEAERSVQEFAQGGGYDVVRKSSDNDTYGQVKRITFEV